MNSESVQDALQTLSEAWYFKFSFLILFYFVWFPKSLKKGRIGTLDRNEP